MKREIDLPFWKFRKLGSLGNLSKGEVKFFESGENDLPLPLYKGEKGVVIFLPINSEKKKKKNQPLDLHRTVECGRYVATCCINCSVRDIEVSGTCLWHLKRHSYVGTHPKHANFPTSYQTPLLWITKRVEFWGLLWEGEAWRRKIIKWA